MRLAYFLSCLLLLAGCRPAPSDPATRPPNIIFIMADDLGYGDLGSYGQPVIPTRALDQMAAEGLRFTQCYTGSPVCAPSRSVLMTGLHTGHTTVRGNSSREAVSPSNPQGRISLRDEDVTVAEVLRQAGYVTGMFGKWGLGEPGTPGLPTEQGFDEWLGFLNQRRAHSHYPEYLWQNQDTFWLPGNRDGGRQTHTHTVFAQQALDFIHRQRDTAFFLYLPFTLPHDELAATPEYAARYADRPWTEEEKAYAAMVEMVDETVGQLLDSLRAWGLAERTLVFFCSDNGAARRWEGRFDSSGPLRGRKRDLYEGGIRTPMIAWMPGTVPAGEVSDLPWTFADLLPTLAEVAGGQTPPGLDGHSVWPALQGQPLDLGTRAFYWEFHEGGFFQAVRQGRWKGIRAGLDGPLALYDLAQDPAETTDVAAQHPEQVQALTQWLDTTRRETPYWPLP